LINLLAFIFVFSILVFFHEFGHFISAKLSGVRVLKFAFGMGPKILSFNRNETEYMICLVPMGGFVKIAGEIGQLDSEVLAEEKIPENQRFDRKPFWTRIFIIIFGPIMNIIISLLIISLVLFINGVPTISNSIYSVIKDGPAEEAGFMAGDIIIAIDSIEIKGYQNISEIINKNIDKNIKITIERNEEILDLYVTPQYDEDYNRGMIGIEFEVIVQKINLFTALGKGIITTKNIIKLIFSNTLEMITGKVPLEIAGPLGIAQMSGEAAKLGWLNLLYFTAILSIFIGLFNLLPIPALDGGHIIILTIEKLRGRPLEAEKMNFIYLIGLSIIVFIFIFATYKDIARIIFQK